MKFTNLPIKRDLIKTIVDYLRRGEYARAKKVYGTYVLIGGTRKFNDIVENVMKQEKDK